MQLLHVYAKNYEGNGQIILIRIVRYSLDGKSSHLICAPYFDTFSAFAGLMLAQVRTISLFIG